MEWNDMTSFSELFGTPWRHGVRVCGLSGCASLEASAPKGLRAIRDVRCGAGTVYTGECEGWRPSVEGAIGQARNNEKVMK